MFGATSYASETALQGKIVKVENDGTLWFEADESYTEEYKKVVDHVLQNHTRIHYNLVRIHIHGLEIGYDEVSEYNPRIQTYMYAAKLMKEKFTNKKSFIYCLEMNKTTYMPSCITEIDNLDVANFLIKNGLSATKTTEKTPEEYKLLLENSEKQAKSEAIGVWSSMQGLFGKSVY